MAMEDSSLLAFLTQQQPLLLLTILAILLIVTAGMVRRNRPQASHMLRNLGYLGLTAALLLTVAKATQHATRSDAALLLNKQPELTVSGNQTTIAMSRDGHFWLEAQVNGIGQDFLIDTGASFTNLSQETARAAGVLPDETKMPIELNTANGTIVARIGYVTRFSFGTISTSHLEVVIAPGNGDTNLIGMNLLSQLASWRVDGRTMVLVPKRAAAQPGKP